MNTPELDKKLRRKARRIAKQMGVHCPDLLQAQKMAQRKFSKLGELNTIIDTGSMSNKLAANKAKREMNTIWLKSGRDAFVTTHDTPEEVKHEVISALEKNI
jgi:hypothetical protein